MANYSHDCPECHFLGTETLMNKKMDIYYCTKGALPPTMVVRFGHQDSEYTSMPVQFIDLKGFPEDEILKAMKTYKDKIPTT